MLPLCFVCKGTPNLKNGRVVGVLRLARFQQVRLDFIDRFLQLFGRTEQGNRVAVAFTHFSAVETLQYRNVIIDDCFGKRKNWAVVMIKSLSNISGHLNVLDLISPHWHAMGVEDQDIRRHQNRIRKESHGRSKIGILPRRFVRLH